ncbi:hypothetical protein ACLESD_16820 [Pyxidicoccus sp. 3LFB2]
MLKHQTVRRLLWTSLLGGALLTSGCAGAQVGVGLGFTTAAPWGTVSVVETTSSGWYGGGMRWYP